MSDEIRVERDRKRHRGALVVLAVVATGFVLHFGAGVFVPLAYAIMSTAAVAPLHRRLRPRVGEIGASTISFVVVMAVIAALGLGIAAAFRPVIHDFEWYRGHAETAAAQATAWAEQRGLDPSALEQGSSWLREGGRMATELISGSTLFIGFLVLGLVELPRLGSRIDRAFAPDTAMRLRTGLGAAAADVWAYLWIRTVIGLLTGLGVALLCYAIGLDLVWMWGVSSFLLNYIPTLGSVIAMVPPVLYAMATGGSSEALLVAAVLGGFQIAMGIVIDPLLQGRRLSLSALVVLLAVTLWGWIWGIPGAFIAIPVTMLIVRVCRSFPAAAWLHHLVAEDHREANANEVSTTRSRRGFVHALRTWRTRHT